MNIAGFSVARPVAVTMRIASLVLLGAISLTRLPLDLLPKVTIPTIAVSTNWPNVAPEEIEAQVTRPVERAVSSVPGLYQVSSSTSEGSSSVRVQFQWGVDIGQAAVDVLQAVERARRSFPTDPTLQNPIVTKFDPATLPILNFGVSGEPDPVKLRTLLDNQVSPMIESADGVASATVSGGLQRAIIVDVDIRRLQAYHLSLNDVSRRLDLENVNLPAGIARQGNTEYVIRSLGWFTSPDEMGKIPVGSFNGQLVPLSQVANVRDAYTERRYYTRMNGSPSVTLSVTKQSEANTVTTAAAVREKIAAAQKLYPYLKFNVAYDQARFIEASVHDVASSAAIGGLLAVLILMLFLRNIRSTLVVALSIPISITSTFFLLYLCGFTLNTMSLGGLALATGLIVDDAVVVLENIFRHIERDHRPAPEASVTGANEIMSAVFASTITVMVVFLPLLLLKGQSGQMFTQFALVVIFSIAVSLLDAVTVVPMLASRLIHGEAHREALADSHNRGGLEKLFVIFGRWFDGLDAGYRRTLGWCLHHRAIVVVGAVLITASSYLLVPFVGQELMPPTDSGDIDIQVKMPVGTALEVTNKTMQQIEAIVGKHPAVETALAAAGTSMGGRGGVSGVRSHVGSLTVHLKNSRRMSTLDVITDLRKQLARLPGAQARPSLTDIVSRIMTGGGQNMEIDFFYDDLTALSGVGREALSRLRDIPGLENTDVNWQDSTPELQWRVDREKATQMGLSFTDVASLLNTATNGDIATYFQDKGFQYPVVVQVREEQRKTIPELMMLSMRPALSTAQTRDVLLAQIARCDYGTGPSEITRLDRRRYIAVTGQVQGRAESEIQADVVKALGGMKMPSGMYWEWGTQQKRRAEEFAGLGMAVFLAIALIYMLLASQFESFVHPLTILLSVPLSAVGVVLALFLSGRSFGLTAFVGLLMLVGIVVKNGILLIDYTNLLRRNGLERTEAVLTAGPTRLRPILMTTSAAVLGMLPLAIGFGAGSETQAPMATAVVGGLLASTMLTLLVVPTVYTLFDDMGHAFRRHRDRA